jgi:hypothetical protein
MYAVPALKSFARAVAVLALCSFAETGCDSGPTGRPFAVLLLRAPPASQAPAFERKLRSEFAKLATAHSLSIADASDDWKDIEHAKDLVYLQVYERRISVIVQWGFAHQAFIGFYGAASEERPREIYNAVLALLAANEIAFDRKVQDDG